MFRKNKQNSWSCRLLLSVDVFENEFIIGNPFSIKSRCSILMNTNRWSRQKQIMGQLSILTSELESKRVRTSLAVFYSKIFRTIPTNEHIGARLLKRRQKGSYETNELLTRLINSSFQATELRNITLSYTQYTEYRKNSTVLGSGHLLELNS